MTEPAQADIDRLAEMLDAEGVSASRSTAHALLEQGVQLPPAPQPAWTRGERTIARRGGLSFLDAKGYWPESHLDAVVDALNAAEDRP